MNWLESNPLGVVLAGVCGFLILVGAALTLAWSGPVDTRAAEGEINPDDLPQLPAAGEDLGAIKDYQVVNDRPLFNESRRPVVAEVADVSEEPVEVATEDVADAPNVRLTGVVITPDAKIVSLTPVEGGKTIMVREGNPLEGEYVGWSVSEVSERDARLSSADGSSMRVELMVHDAMIERPPEPEPRVREEEELMDEEANGREDADQEEANLSRAEEIRQRIRERREQLRREAQDETDDEDDQREARRNAYQDAIQAMMQRNKSNDNDSDGDSE